MGGIFPSLPPCLANKSRFPIVFASKDPKSTWGSRCYVKLILSPLVILLPDHINLTFGNMVFESYYHTYISKIFLIKKRSAGCQ